MACCCECGDELSGSIKCGEFPEYPEGLLASREGVGSME
jgi:hypothetical protein